jgi:hypothetical protein
MSSISLKISAEPFNLSIDSQILVDDYDAFQKYLEVLVTILDDTDISSSSTPISFKRIPCHISSKRFDFLTSECQLLTLPKK